MEFADRLSAENRDLLLDLALAISERRSVDELFTSFASGVRGPIPFDFCSLIVVTADREFIRIVGQFPDVPGGSPPGTIAPAVELGLGLFGADAAGQQYRPRQVPLDKSRILVDGGYERAWTAPLVAEGVSYGLLTVGKESSEPFSEEDLHYLRAAGTLLASAVRQDLQLGKARKSAARASAASELLIAVQSGEAIRDLFLRVPTVLGDCLEADYIGLILDDGSGFRVVAESPERVHKGNPPTTEGDKRIRELAAPGDFLQFRPTENMTSSNALFQSGYGRGALSFLRDGEDLQGLLLFARINPRKFDSDEQKFIELLRSILSQGLANQRRVGRAEAAAARSALLNDLALLLHNGDSLEAFFDILSAQLQRAVPFAGLVLLVQAAEPKTYRVVEGLRRRTFAPGQIVREDDLGEFVLSRVAAGALFVEGETLELGGDVALSARKNGTIRGGIAAIRHRSETVGYLLLGRTTNQQFIHDEQIFLELVCTLAGQALANLQKVSDAMAQAIRSEVLSELSRLLEGGENIASNFQRVSELLLRAVGFDFLSITARNAATDGFTYVRSHELFLDGEPLGFNSASIAVVEQNPAAITQYRTSESNRMVPTALYQAGFLRGATAAMTSPEGTEGLLTIGRQDDTPFTADEMSFIGLLASLFGQASANYQKTSAREAEAVRNRVLGELALLVNNGEPIEMHFGQLVKLLFETQAFDFCALTCRTSDRSGFRLLRSHDLPGDDGLPHPERMEAMRQRGVRSSQYGIEATARGAPKGLFEIGIGRAASIVLVAGSSDEGLLTVGRRSLASFTPEEMTFFELLGTLIAYAVANESRIAQSTAEAEEQAIIAAAASAVAGENNALSIVRSLRTAVSRFIPLPFISFGYLEDGQLRFPSRDGVDVVLPIGDDFRAALENGQETVSSNLVGTGTHPSAIEVRRMGIFSHVLTRAQSAGVPTGILVFGSRDPSFHPGPREERLCRLIADIVGPAMVNARTSDRDRQDAEDQGMLADAASAAARATDEAALVRGLVGPFRNSLPGAKIDVLTVEGDRVRSVITGELLEIGPLFGTALESGESRTENPEQDYAKANQKYRARTRTVRAVAFRLSSTGEALGLLWIGQTRPDHPFTGRQFRLFRLIADIIGPSLANLRESGRRKLDAEEQRFLAQVASAAASATDESALVRALVGPIKESLPGAKIDMLMLEGDGVRGVVTGELLAIGPQFRAALEEGASKAESPDEVFGTENSRFRDRTGVVIATSFRLSSSGVPIGILWIGTTQSGYVFSERQFGTFRLVADIVGPALANLRESGRRKQDAEEQRILADAAASLAAGTSEADILERLNGPVGAFVPEAIVAFNYVENGEMWLFDGRQRRPIRPHTQHALDHGQSLGDVSTTEMSQPSRDLVASVGVNRWVDTAAHSGGVAVGLLFVGTRVKDHEFSRRDMGLLRVIADFTGPAMINARDEARRQRDSEDERVLSEIAAVAARATASSETIEAVAVAMAPLVPGAFAIYGFVEGESVTYQFACPGILDSAESSSLTVPLTTVGREARMTGQSVGSFADPSTESVFSNLGLHDYVKSVYQSAGSPVGMLLVSTNDSAFHFGDRVLNLLRRVTQIVGPAVESSRAEAERARQADLYGLMLRSLSEGVVLADTNGRVVFANELGRRITRAIDPRGSARSLLEVIALLPEHTREGYLAAQQRGESSRGRLQLTVDGKIAWFDYELVALNDPVMRVLFVAADVTAEIERQAEQSRTRDQLEHSQRLAALGELIGGVAHELNNPLTAILGFAEVMGLSPDAAPFSEDLEIIQKEALRARNIVRDLLFIARPGTSERGPVSVPDLVGHIERLRRNAWSQQGISCQIDIQPGCTVWGNDHQLTQVLLNLVTNAEHALDGRPEKRITIRASTTGAKTEIVVSDSGAGMDEATRGRVFEPFFTTKPGLGTGLGLPLSYSIIQAHEGDVRLVSSPGKGTTFIITLPAVPQASATALELATAAPETRKIRVLVIDDEPSLRKVCQRLIASMGHDCLTAGTSAAALELAAENEFDVVLCDYRLGGETADVVIAGFETLAPHLVARTVVVTGATTDSGVLALVERRGLRLIAKPYGAEELAAIIQRAS